MSGRSVKRKLWVTSSFDSVSDFFPEVKPKPCSSKSETTLNNKYDTNQDLWSDKHAPKKRDDLAVHKKKISEVEEWLKESCLSSTEKRESSILLLTGPAGAGKSATIQVLCKEMKIEVKEWINPVDLIKNDFLDENPKFSESQVNVFWDFMFRANKYPSLEILGEDSFSKRLVLIEDFPNVFFQNVSELHRILRHFNKVKQCCAVFILSDNTSVNVRQLFPQKFQEELGITCINYNAVSPSSMLRILTKVAAAEISPVPSKHILESLSQLTSGDIRMALNTLQFTHGKANQSSKISSHTKTRASVKRERKGTRKGKPELEPVPLSADKKDNSLFVFHALGKILHCKRALDEPTDGDDLPPCLKPKARHPLLTEPEEIVRNMSLSSSSIGLFLHQNYQTFFNDVEELGDASKHLSDSDILTSEWTGRLMLEECAGLVAVRGVMHSNPSQTRSGWHPIYKPYWFTANKLIYTRKFDIRHLCEHFLVCNEALLTEILPFYHVMRLPYKRPDIANLSRQFCSFTSNSLSYQEQLHERDVLAEGDESCSFIPNAIPSQSNPHPKESPESHSDDDDEYEIEYSD